MFFFVIWMGFILVSNLIIDCLWLLIGGIVWILVFVVKCCCCFVRILIVFFCVLMYIWWLNGVLERCRVIYLFCWNGLWEDVCEDVLFDGICFVFYIISVFWFIVSLINIMMFVVIVLFVYFMSFFEICLNFVVDVILFFCDVFLCGRFVFDCLWFWVLFMGVLERLWIG